MSLNLTAYLNQRFQFTYNVAIFAARYAALASADWRFQVRPSSGSPLALLDFRTGGTTLMGSGAIDYRVGPPPFILVRCPASLLLTLRSGAYAFDFGFILTNADFERVDGGSLTFLPGVTIATVIGEPTPPVSGKDTVLP